ncbi:MAG: thioredoxin family protein [Candidatus Bathyarchaeota archaeon]|nr:thioredoxin family protein [Candidatus Bathyarchaeota archaeon]
MSIVNLQHTDWDREVAKADKPVAVEFWHQSCPTCKKIEPTVLELPSKLGDRVKLARLNVLDNKENRRFAIEKGVIGTPTFKIYCRGVEIGEIVGLETLTNLQGTIENIAKGCA